MRFLHRHDLIGVGTALISLNNADLRRANLSGLGLQGSLITDANLSKADLSDAKFCNYRPTGADWDRAFVRGVLQSNLSQPIQESYLIGSNLRRAVLTAVLIRVDLEANSQRGRTSPPHLLP
jgi:uncharacterized protein YjbI with pentapeptide repeats